MEGLDVREQELARLFLRCLIGASKRGPGGPLAKR